MNTDLHDIKFRLTFDIDPGKYPYQHPAISVTASDSTLSRGTIENFRISLEHYCNQLNIGMMVKCP